MVKKLTPEERAALIQRRLAGASLRVVAEEFGISHTRVKQLAKDHSRALEREAKTKRALELEQRRLKRRLERERASAGNGRPEHQRKAKSAPATAPPDAPVTVTRQAGTTRIRIAGEGTMRVGWRTPQRDAYLDWLDGQRGRRDSDR